jgi:hypothetical protein
VSSDSGREVWEELEDRLASRSLAAGDPTGWFDRLYAAGVAGEVPMPWDRTAPHPLLVQWAQAQGLAASGQRAVVVGCGLGADAEQALPDPPRRTAIVNVGRLVAPGGTLFVIAARQDQSDAEVKGPPWPLTREEIDAFTSDGLSPVRIEEVSDPRSPNGRRWRAEFHRPA